MRVKNRVYPVSGNDLLPFVRTRCVVFPGTLLKRRQLFPYDERRDRVVLFIWRLVADQHDPVFWLSVFVPQLGQQRAKLRNHVFCTGVSEFPTVQADRFDGPPLKFQEIRSGECVGDLRAFIPGALCKQTNKGRCIHLPRLLHHKKSLRPILRFHMIQPVIQLNIYTGLLGVDCFSHFYTLVSR